MEEALREVKEKRPLIIEAPQGAQIEPQDDGPAGDDLELSPGLAVLIEYVRAHYDLVGTVGPDEWAVYRHREAGQ